MADGSQDARGWKIAALLWAALSIGAVAFALHQYRSASGLARQLASVTGAAESFRVQLGYAETRVTDLTGQLAVAQQRLHAESRPELPVLFDFHNALAGGSQVAVIRNLSRRALRITVEAQSLVTGAHFIRSYLIHPRGQVQIGKAQGWLFGSGQMITVSSPKYRPLVRTVS